MTATSAGVPVVGARVCLWKGTEVYAVAMTNSSGQASFEPEPSSGGTMTVTAIARNHLPYEGTATVNEGTPPSKPTGLAATGGDAEVSLAWSSLLMTPTGAPDEYGALIPAQPCGTLIDYYILAVDENHNRETHPDFAPAVYHSFSVDFTVVFEDDFETDRGWTVGAADDDATTGIWERCDPQGTTAQPEDDHTPPPGTHAYITQCAAGSGQGSYDVDGGKTTLFSPVFDLSGYSSAVASYYRWYSNNTGSNPGTDYWVVHVTDDGWSTWSVLENTNTTNRSWVRMQFDLESYVELNDQVQFRFIASDEGSGSIVEAGVDDFAIGGCLLPSDTIAPTVLLIEPNPFNPSTRIDFGMPRAGRATLEIYSVLGERVAILADGVYGAGYHSAVWPGTTAQGSEAASGVYFYRLTADGRVLTRKMLLLK